MSVWEKLRGLFRDRQGTGVRADAPRLVDRIVNGGLRQLSDAELMQVVVTLLNTPTYRTALRGNARFLESVSTSYAKKRSISMRQREALYNILERAYPHNLIVELLRVPS
jgi:hypothetical protein